MALKVVVNEVEDPITGVKVRVAAYGINTETGVVVDLGDQPISKVGAGWNSYAKSFVIRDREVEVYRGAGHPQTEEPGYDVMELSSDNDKRFDRLVEDAKRKHWHVWSIGCNPETGKPIGVMYKPSGVDKAWSDPLRAEPVRRKFGVDRGGGAMSYPESKRSHAEGR